MNNYTIYCTEEQTKKALELGAPIKTCGYYYKQQFGCNTVSETDLHIIPTTEQMIGWLEKQKKIGQVVALLHILIKNRMWIGYILDNSGRTVFESQNFSTRKEAVLSAIDAALDYLTNQNSKEC